MESIPKNTSNTEIKFVETKIDENIILTIIKDMLKWIRPITSITQDTENGYQIICDDHYKYKNQLENVYKYKNLNWTESRIKKIIISILNEGINNCPIWHTSRPYMAHFNKLKKILNDMQIELENSIAEMEEISSDNSDAYSDDY